MGCGTWRRLTYEPCLPSSNIPRFVAEGVSLGDTLIAKLYLVDFYLIFPNFPVTHVSRTVPPDTLIIFPPFCAIFIY